MNYLNEDNDVDSPVHSHVSEELSKKEWDGIKRENLDEDNNSQPVECLRRNNFDELEDFDVMFENIKTTNITPIPLINRSNHSKRSLNRKCTNSVVNRPLQFEDLSIASNSTFIENKCSPLQLELSPINEDTLDEDCKNLLILDTSSEWYTIDQWKLHGKSSQLSNSTYCLKGSVTDEVSNINPNTCERSIELIKDTEENELCFEEKKLTQKIDAITFENKTNHTQENLFKLPGTSMNKILMKGVNDINDSLEETKTNNLPKDGIENSAKLKVFIQSDSLIDVKSQREYKSTRVQSKNINSKSKSRRLTKKTMLDSYDNIHHCESIDYNINQEFKTKHKKNHGSNDISMGNKEVNNDEFMEDYDTNFLAGSDFGRIGLNNTSDNEVFNYNSKFLDKKNTCHLESIPPRYSPSFTKIFSYDTHTSFSEDADQDFLELL